MRRKKNNNLYLDDEQSSETHRERLARLRAKGRAILGRRPRPDERVMGAKPESSKKSKFNRGGTLTRKKQSPKGKVNPNASN